MKSVAQHSNNNDEKGGERLPSRLKENATLSCCCCRLFLECCSCSGYWFTIEEGSKILDIPASFCPNSKTDFGAKFVITIFVIAFWLYDYITYKFKGWFFAYFTNLALILSLLYVIISLCNSLFPTKQPLSNNDSNLNGKPVVLVPNWWIRMSWILAELALHAQMMATLLYWLLEFNPEDHDVHFSNVMKHGGVLILVFMDVRIINQIPIRMKHWYLVFLYDILYVGWTAIQGLAPVTNPKTNGENLYNVLQWNEDWQFCLIIVVGLSTASFILYSFMYALSLFSLFPALGCNGRNRRYIMDELPISINQTQEQEPYALSEGEIELDNINKDGHHTDAGDDDETESDKV